MDDEQKPQPKTLPSSQATNPRTSKDGSGSSVVLPSVLPSLPPPPHVSSELPQVPTSPRVNPLETDLPKPIVPLPKTTLQSKPVYKVQPVIIPPAVSQKSSLTGPTPIVSSFLLSQPPTKPPQAPKVSMPPPSSPAPLPLNRTVQMATATPQKFSPMLISKPTPPPFHSSTTPKREIPSSPSPAKTIVVSSFQKSAPVSPVSQFGSQPTTKPPIAETLPSKSEVERSALEALGKKPALVIGDGERVKNYVDARLEDEGFWGKNPGTSQIAWSLIKDRSALEIVNGDLPTPEASRELHVNHLLYIEAYKMVRDVAVKMKWTPRPGQTVLNFLENAAAKGPLF